MACLSAMEVKWRSGCQYSWPDGVFLKALKKLAFSRFYVHNSVMKCARQDKFHDRGYKLLFSHPQMVEDLLRVFVKEDFVKEIDFSKLKRVPSSFVTSDFYQRESDIIWQTEFRGKKAYIYLLIEFQSTVDRFMAIRMLSYIMLFYLDLLKKVKSGKGQKKLPAVFPIMLYNGNEKWNSPEKISELIELPSGSLKQYIPEFRYFRICENEFPGEDLMKLNTLTSLLFQIETGNYKKIGLAVKNIYQLLDKNVSKELKINFGIWLRNSLRAGNIEIDFENISETEVTPMLEKTIENLKKTCYQEGMQEGRHSGRLEGRQEGKQEGKLEGKQEGKLEGMLEAAKKMLALGIELNKISEVTGISVKELKKLLN